MGKVLVSYNQMLAAKQVYEDVQGQIVDAVYNVAGHSGVIDMYEKGVRLLVLCSDTRAVYRMVTGLGLLIEMQDVMSMIVMGNCPRFVVDKLSNDDLVVTTIGETEDLKPILLSPPSHGLGNLMVAGASVAPKNGHIWKPPT